MKFITDNILFIAMALVSGGMLLWPSLRRARGGATLDTLRATRLINDSQAVVVDVSEPAEFNAGHLPGARNIPLAELDKRLSELPDKPLLVTCASGQRSQSAVATLRKAGRAESYSLLGGLREWRQAGLPVVK